MVERFVMCSSSAAMGNWIERGSSLAAFGSSVECHSSLVSARVLRNVLWPRHTRSSFPSEHHNRAVSPRSENAGFKEIFTLIQDDLKSIKNEIKSVKDELSKEIKEVKVELSAEIKVVKDELSAIKVDVKDIQVKLKGVEVKLENVVEKQDFYAILMVIIPTAVSIISGYTKS